MSKKKSIILFLVLFSFCCGASYICGYRFSYHMQKAKDLLEEDKQTQKEMAILSDGCLKRQNLQKDLRILDKAMRHLNSASKCALTRTDRSKVRVQKDSIRYQLKQIKRLKEVFDDIAGDCGQKTI